MDSTNRLALVEKEIVIGQKATACLDKRSRQRFYKASWEGEAVTDEESADQLYESVLVAHRRKLESSPLFYNLMGLEPADSKIAQRLEGVLRPIESLVSQALRALAAGGSVTEVWSATQEAADRLGEATLPARLAEAATPDEAVRPLLAELLGDRIKRGLVELQQRREPVIRELAEVERSRSGCGGCGSRAKPV
jgi:hypothetical protein